LLLEKPVSEGAMGEPVCGAGALSEQTLPLPARAGDVRGQVCFDYPTAP
jgi:hypothetical protein